MKTLVWVKLKLRIYCCVKLNEKFSISLR